ncbi:MAG: ATP synthase subunit I [Xanthomonadales bacterium]
MLNFRVQSAVAALLVLTSLLAGPVAAYSALLGSLAAFVPGAIFSALVMRRLGGDSAAFLRTAMVAEFGKLALVGILCAAVFIWVKPLAAGFFFLGLIGMIIANRVASVLMVRDGSADARKRANEQTD